MRRFLTIFLTTAVLSLTALAQGGDEYMKYVDRAETAISKKNYEEAIGWLKEAMHSEPSNPQNIMLLSNVGMLYHYNGEDSLALHTLSEARAMAPASVVVLNNRATVLTSMGRDDDALADYARIIEMDSTFADAYYSRAALELMRGQFDKAEADIGRFIELAPKDLNGKLILAVLYSNTRRPEEAAELYGELIKVKPEAVYYSARAMCRLELEQLFEASDDIAKGLELDPNDGELYFCRAVLNQMRYRPEDAKADARKAIELGVAPARVKALGL